MLEYYGCSDRFDEVCQWYDGYHFGNTRIFNSWSVISYISDHCEPKAFWQSQGVMILLRKSFHHQHLS
ncbi:MAG: hypothetical protein PUE44_03300 [Bulleidia sp.]|nr:hypothetical protein [Bulleidia sp.]MDY4809406.1 hypothetical protein [Bulleidia sp.]